MLTTKAPTRLLSVKHATHYRYEEPIKRSIHRLHLHPIQNGNQYVRSYRLAIAPEVPVIEYEDVFGNGAAHFEIKQPYTELSIIAESFVELVDVNPFAFASLPIRPSFPLVWMPWERMMLEPYLQPVELPELQLKELYAYAMSFVERNDHDLMETLFAINLTLYREYQYVAGSTNLETTPFEVYTSKIGVCQDFANLFICLARLLGIPRATFAATSTPATTPSRERAPMPRTLGSSSTSPMSAGRGSIRPTARCRAPTTSGLPTADTSAIPRPPPGPSSRPPPSARRCASMWWSRRFRGIEGSRPVGEPHAHQSGFDRTRSLELTMARSTLRILSRIGTRGRSEQSPRASA